MKQYKYRINGSLYNVVINNTTDETAEVEVNGIPYTVEIEKKIKKIVSSPFKKPAQATTRIKHPRDQTYGKCKCQFIEISASGYHPRHQLQCGRYRKKRTKTVDTGSHENGKQYYCG